MNRTLYSCLFYLALPLVALRLWLRARKAPAYAQRVGERFSYGLPVMRPGGIWVHAVSVGESIAAAPMIRGLLERYPQLPITVTCMTPTGSERIQALFANEPRIQHCYLPYDLPFAVRRFLRAFRPVVGIGMETETWPNLLAVARDEGVPMVLVNARLSEKSLAQAQRTPNLVREAAGQTLQPTALVHEAYLRLVHSPADALAFERIINVPKRGLGDKAMATMHAAARSLNLPLPRAAAALASVPHSNPRHPDRHETARALRTRLPVRSADRRHLSVPGGALAGPEHSRGAADHRARRRLHRKPG